MTSKLLCGVTAATAVCLMVASGCQREQASSAPPPYGSPPPGGSWQAPAPQGQPQVATALTPFGALLSQLPQFPLQLPPLPTPDAWMQQYWPFPLPAPSPGPAPVPQDQWPAEWVGYEDQVLQETNAYRAVGASCGGKPFGPAAPLSPHPQLRNAARGHSRDMAERGYFDHQSPDGLGPMQRAQAAGFGGGFVGENIAAGYRTPREVVRGWMDSPGHCLNIMEPRYRYLGVGYYFRANSSSGMAEYWTQNFGG